MSLIRPLPEPSSIEFDRRRDHPVDLAGDREFVARRVWAQPAVFRDRRSHCFFLTIFGQPRGVGAGQGVRAGSPDPPPIGQSDGAQDLPLLSIVIAPSFIK